MRVFRWRDFCASVNDNNIIDNWVYHCILYDGSFPRRRLWLPSSPLPLLLLPVHCMVVSVRVWACERLSMGIEKPTCDYSLWQNQFGTHALHSILFSVFCLMHHHSPLTHSIHPPPPIPHTQSPFVQMCEYFPDANPTGILITHAPPSASHSSFVIRPRSNASLILCIFCYRKILHTKMLISLPLPTFNISN